MPTFLLKLFLVASLMSSVFQAQAQVAFTDYKFKDKFEMNADLKKKIQNTLEEYLLVKGVSEYAEKELRTYFGNAEFTYEKMGEKFRFKYAGKLTAEQRAVDRCEGELLPEGKSEDERFYNWKIEIDYCNFDL